jgi:exodeoxyribonuclease V beta subunit
MTPPFHLVETPVEPGITLIEASAGTGKTFTIAGIFLRLIVENRATVREILVVTFTEAATGELRGRIRQMLADALAAFAAGASEDRFFAGLLARHASSTAGVRRRLDAALRGFDEAPIYTIHGFCQRTLKDRAVESGALFDTELIQDQFGLLQEIADDYWRTHFYPAPALLLGSVLEGNLGPDPLLKLFEAIVRHPELRLISKADDLPLNEAQAELINAFDTAREIWCMEEEAVRSHFGDGQKWCNKPYNSTLEMSSHFARLKDCFDGSASVAGFESLGIFSTSALAAKVNHRGRDNHAPKHAFFDACEKLIPAQEVYRLAVLHDFARYARDELPRRKQERKLQSYDDLLTRLRDALSGEGSVPLASQLRARYRAALIDEFQDTDPVQFEIFQGVFGVPSSMLFYIGDPKQAIYGFRGADIFTYLAAKEHTSRRYTLVHNWRSESGLVRAVNTLFQQPQKPFVFAGIDFEPVEACGKADETPLLFGGRNLAPLQFWFWPRGEDGKVIPTGRMEEYLPGVVASEIARHLTGNASIGGRSVRPQDIAVLVLKHKQARLIQEALQRLNIPCVLHTEASVFDSREAMELRRVLEAIAQPGNEALLRAALVTDCCGVSGYELEQLSTEEPAWQAIIERFSRYHHKWSDPGFVAMFREWLQGENVRQRLLAQSDGERRLTNLLHLSELLHGAELERRLAPAGLVRWLADQIHNEDKPAEEHQLRLERDDDAVRLVTIHKSKGLEYPIVFCPFAWRQSDVDARPGKRSYEKEVCFHQAEPPHPYVRDLGSDDFEQNKTRAMVENLAENVRLIYVALTRAKHRCCVVWGAFNNAESSALAWLLHRPANPNDVSPVHLLEHFPALTDAELHADLDRIVRASTGVDGKRAIEVIDLPPINATRFQSPAVATDSLHPRSFTATIRRDWCVTSFSGLASSRSSEQPDHDAVRAASLPQDEPAAGIFAFPAGTKAGTCLHEIFEALEFTGSNANVRLALISEKLRIHGYPPDKWRNIVADTVERALHVPLEPGRGDFTLARVPSAARIDELEFCFPIERLSPATFRGAFNEQGSPDGMTERWLRQLHFSTTNGYVKGYIDLVFRFEGRFYIVDWKSNRLGYRIEDYSQEAMHRAMADELYPLQYLLYTVALHRQLQLRLPGYDYEKHFGGVFYLFVRGIDPTRPEFGVYGDRPAAGLIERLSQGLDARRKAAGV